ncbi:hypothetical protein AWB74_08880 [Caballeronia arvi]|uniref:Uncharacterized protein n=1 Tax=Caballeronia arvi TaxID=1777135 RepID=A0A158L7A5_9BURK|nr:hypothetical protein AWB74_08880 [Caballeronia arvi]
MVLHRKSLISHKVSNDQGRVGNVEYQATKNTPAHMVFVQYPWRTFFAQVAGEDVLEIRVLWQIKSKRKKRRNNIVDLDLKWFRIDAKFEFHGSLLKSGAARRRKMRRRPGNLLAAGESC